LTVTVYDDEIAALDADDADDADLPAGRLTVPAPRIKVFARGQRGDGLLQRGYGL
jgi:hypothetical protein